MRRGQCRPFRTVQRLRIPFLCIEIQIMINRFASIINKHPAAFTDDSYISNIASAVQNGLKLFQDTITSFAVNFVRKKIVLDILVARNQIGNIFHVIDVGVNVLVHLLDDCLCIL